MIAYPSSEQIMGRGAGAGTKGRKIGTYSWQGWGRLVPNSGLLLSNESGDRRPPVPALMLHAKANEILRAFLTQRV